MKVLKVNYSDTSGGAARAAYRLHRGLIEQGIDSKMLVQKKQTKDPSVITPHDSKTAKLLSELRPFVSDTFLKLQQTTNTVIHSVNILPSGLHRKINRSDADIVHLHWVNGEMLSVKEIAKITKPIVWTLHDMWAFSGAEHYDDLNSPERYREGYNKKNRPSGHRGVDIDRWTWQRKRRHWADKEFTIVTPSTWMADCARQSPLFKNKNIQAIPNGINLDVYKPIPGEWAREVFNVPQHNETKYILFGALSSTSDERKGFRQLQKALSHLGNNNYRLLVFGSEGYDNIDFTLPTSYLGRLNDDETLALAYSAADIMVVPSLQDNLPNTAVESLASGTPVAAFDTGGLSDIVDHHKNGYLAEAFEPEDLANGIEWILEDDERNKKLSMQARTKAEETFSLGKVVKRYVDLYEKLQSKQDFINM